MSFRKLASLLGDQAWLRRYRAWRAEMLPWRFHLPFVRNEVRKRTLEEWRSSYILPGDDANYLAYVPAPVDVMAGYRLLKPYAPPWLLRTLLQRGDCFIDVGANLGDWTLPAARLVGQGGRVLAFEPVPQAAAALRKSAWVNRMSQVQVFERALSNRSGQAEFSVERENSGGSRLNRMADDAGRSFTHVKVEVGTLDEASAALAGVALVKIDVEGYEAEVLQGATQMLARLRPALHLETGHETPEQRRVIADLLGRAGYELAGIVCNDGVVEASLQDYAAKGGSFANLPMANILVLPK
jgi:FkbM family methyltransferase